MCWTSLHSVYIPGTYTFQIPSSIAHLPDSRVLLDGLEGGVEDKGGVNWLVSVGGVSDLKVVVVLSVTVGGASDVLEVGGEL